MRVAAWLTATGVMLATVTAHAATYRVDLVVFASLAPAEEQPAPARAPDLARALESGDAARLASARIRLLPTADFGLGNVWQRLRSSKSFSPIARLAWVHKDPPSDNGPRLHLREGERLQIGGSEWVHRLDGTVALLAGRFLHLDVDLLHTEPLPGGGWGSYRLKESRKLKIGEIHYLDSAKLGIVARVQKLGV